MCGVYRRSLLLVLCAVACLFVLLYACTPDYLFGCLMSVLFKIVFRINPLSCVINLFSMFFGVILTVRVLLFCFCSPRLFRFSCLQFSRKIKISLRSKRQGSTFNHQKDGCTQFSILFLYYNLSVSHFFSSFFLLLLLLLLLLTQSSHIQHT